jgi:hypothetical protein
MSMDKESVRRAEIREAKRLLRRYNKYCCDRGGPEEQFGTLIEQDADGRPVKIYKKLKDMTLEESAKCIEYEYKRLQAARERELRLSAEFLLRELDEPFDDDDDDQADDNDDQAAEDNQ